MKIHEFILLIVSIFLIFSCKTENKKNVLKKKTAQELENKIDINSKKDTITKNNLTLDYLQGFWRSYSYYLEHERENKDFHSNEYYKVVNSKKSLEIVLKEHDLDSIAIKTNIIGFIDEKKSNIKISNLKNKGNFFVKVKYLKNDIYKKNIIKIKSNDISNHFESYFDGNNIFNDYFDYRFLNDTITEKVTFIKLSILPKSIFEIIKTQSKKDQRDYIKEFNIKGFSSKIKVIVDTTYFYNDEALQDKRKAFLVKGDVAYLEEEAENYVKVYFDAKTSITAGYLKQVDIEILK